MRGGKPSLLVGLLALSLVLEVSSVTTELRDQVHKKKKPKQTAAWRKQLRERAAQYGSKNIVANMDWSAVCSPMSKARVKWGASGEKMCLRKWHVLLMSDAQRTDFFVNVLSLPKDQLGKLQTTRTKYQLTTCVDTGMKEGARDGSVPCSTPGLYEHGVKPVSHVRGVRARYIVHKLSPLSLEWKFDYDEYNHLLMQATPKLTHGIMSRVLRIRSTVSAAHLEAETIQAMFALAYYPTVQKAWSSLPMKVRSKIMRITDPSKGNKTKGTKKVPKTVAMLFKPPYQSLIYHRLEDPLLKPMAELKSIRWAAVSMAQNKELTPVAFNKVTEMLKRALEVSKGIATRLHREEFDRIAPHLQDDLVRLLTEYSHNPIPKLKKKKKK